MYKIELDWNPPTGNGIKKMQHWKYAKLREEWKNRLRAYFVKHKTPFPGNRKVYMILARRRLVAHGLDRMNLIWTFKPALDVLQELNVLIDDNEVYLEDHYVQVEGIEMITIWLTTDRAEFEDKKRSLELLQGS